MTWEDALRVGFVVIGSLGGVSVIVLGLAGWLGKVWADRLAQNQRRESEKALATLRGEVEGGLKRLDAALGHRSFLMQRFAEMELEGLRECWQKARACLPAINGPRGMNSGTNLDEFRTRTEVLRVAHNSLMESLGNHEPFLPEPVVTLVEQVRQKVNLELLQIGTQEPFTSGGDGKDWWDQGHENQKAVNNLTEALKVVVRARVVELTTERSQS